MVSLDSQQVEILGRAALTASIVGDGLEVATPERDNGIDLLAFLVDPWKVIPIQMKASSSRAFSLFKKHERVPGLVMAYVWHASVATDVEIYAMTWNEAKQVADGLGWTKTASWEREGYSTTNASKRVQVALEQYRISEGSWMRFVSPPPI